MDDAEKQAPPNFAGPDSEQGVASEKGALAAHHGERRDYGSLQRRRPDGLEAYCSVLQVAPGLLKESRADYSNVTPWVTRLFFVHTYFAYIYVFYMFVLAFYKGYALEYPTWRRWAEMVLIMLIPCVQHLRFYFGHWGNELGMVYDLCAFSFLNAIAMLLLMYFLFLQAYIMPLDSSFLFVAIVLVIVESLCGFVNSLQAMKLRAQTLTQRQTICMTASVVAVLVTFGLFVEQELSGKEALVDERSFYGGRYARMASNLMPPR